jgi:hypothetical protein
MKPLALALALCTLVVSGNAGANQTCKTKAVQAWRSLTLTRSLSRSLEPQIPSA